MKSKWFPFRKLHDQALDAEQRPDLSLIQRDRLSDDGAGGGGLVLPGRRQDTDGLVVAGKTVDTRLNENETELGVLVLAVALKVLADGNSLLDQHVQILRELRSETVGLEDTEDLVTSNEADLGNSVGVTQDDTDLGGGGTTLGETADLLNDLVGSGLQPRGGSAAVGGSRRADTLSLGVKTTHGCGVW